MAVPFFRLYQNSSGLKNTANEIINTLRYAQNKTLSSESASQYGIHFETSKYVLFKGVSYNASAIDNLQYNFRGQVEISEINLQGGGSEVVFDRLSGATDQYGSIVLRLKTDNDKKINVYIDGFGESGSSEFSIPSDDNRTKDSRHTHFNLGWSIQNATQLKLVFYGPEPDQTETINMAAYFNSDKTEFNWSNEGAPFLVSGKDQTFHIHTHSLDIFSTSLCIHRDRNNDQNNEEVRVYIVDGGVEKEIAHYLANAQDDVENGSFVIDFQRQ